jgi:hypothetical protein
MAVVVLIHGIAQEQWKADSLEAEWLPALAGGVRAAGHEELADRLWRRRGAVDGIDVRMAIYADLFLQPGQQGSELGGFASEQEALAREVAREWLLRARDRSTDSRDRTTALRELAHLDPAADASQQGPVQEAARHVVNSLARTSWLAPFGMSLAERFIWKALAQVTAYLTNSAIREAALASVTRLVDENTRVLIGHSLGSVVAFETAHRFEQPLPLLVTLGSPLGLRTIIYERLRPQPPSFPQRVLQWVNIADRNDLVAAEPDLTQMFGASKPPAAQFSGGYTVDCGAQPHRAEFYLGKAVVGKAVAEALAAEASGSAARL